MKLEEGKRYRRKTNKPLCFGEHTGVYFGRTACYWPRFKLSGSREVVINANDSSFVEVKEDLTAWAEENCVSPGENIF